MIVVCRLTKNVCIFASCNSYYILSPKIHTFNAAARSTKGGAVAAQQAALPVATRLRQSREKRRINMNKYKGKVADLRH